MRLCLYRHPTLTPDQPRLGLVRESDLVDVHGVCVASLLGYMRPRRALEIADALCPPDLLSFLEGGRHSWNALRDSLARLGPRLDIAPPTGIEGDAIVLPKEAVRLVPLLAAGAGWATTSFGEWGTTPVPTPGGDVVVALHSDGRAYLPEYLAVVGGSAGPIDERSAIDAIGLVAVVRPSRPESACMLVTPEVGEEEEPGLLDALTRAVLAASHNRTLLVGDIVRCGPPMVAVVPRRITIDLTDSEPTPAAVALVDLDEIVPS